MGAALIAVTLVAARQAAAQTPFERLAPIDLTGTWVSVVTEDWHLRMITPQMGDFEGLPLNEQGIRVASLWDPERDAASGNACKAYGAPAIMRVPGRVRISWQDRGNTLQIQTDAGQQTRRLHFAGVPPRGQAGRQGYSVASWVYGSGFNPLVPPAANERLEDVARAAGGTLKVVTTNLAPGYLRKNGVPYSGQATVTEYFELVADPRGTPWFVVTTVVSDPTYLLRDFITSSNFKKEPDDSKWHSAPCTVQ
ncbi:MAG: hypothetical protein HY657_03660 [Acidobacteria bacterium]|nr:hypothetical protein [Acidobacteriota bacterium]